MQRLVRRCRLIPCIRDWTLSPPRCTWRGFGKFAGWIWKTILKREKSLLEKVIGVIKSTNFFKYSILLIICLARVRVRVTFILLPPTTIFISVIKLLSSCAISRGRSITTLTLGMVEFAFRRAFCTFGMKEVRSFNKRFISLTLRILFCMPPLSDTRIAKRIGSVSIGRM